MSTANKKKQLSSRALIVGAMLSILIVFFLADYLLKVAFALSPSHGALPLSIYVDKSLSSAAEMIESGNYRAALNACVLIRPIYPLVDNQLHYIKGLCFQGLGQFQDAAGEFNYVKTNSTERNLTDRAQLAFLLVQLRQRKLINAEHNFPPGDLVSPYFPVFRGHSR